MQIEGVELSKIAAEFGTPTYVYGAGEIRQRASALQDTFTSRYANTRIHYAVKANSNPHILQIIRELGLGADCTSLGEVFLAKHSGFAAGDIIYTGNYESAQELAAAHAAGVYLNLDDESSLNRLLKTAVPERLSFRINPRFGRGAHAHITTGGEHSKFGIPYEQAARAFKRAKAAGVRSFGVHVMLGSNNLDERYFADMTTRVLERIAPIFRELGERPEVIDLGGGFGVPYASGERELDLEKLADGIVSAFLEGCKKFDLGEASLALEPGRYILASAGTLLTQVTGTKTSYENFVGVDAGMHTLLRPALYNAAHEIVAPYAAGEKRVQNVCGQICESTDVFARDVLLPRLTEGDLLCIKNAGAYGFGLTSNYNGRGKPAEVLVQHGTARLIRRREEEAELLRGVPPSLDGVAQFI